MDYSSDDEPIGMLHEPAATAAHTQKNARISHRIIELRPETYEFMDAKSLCRFTCSSKVSRKDVRDANAWHILAAVQAPRPGGGSVRDALASDAPATHTKIHPFPPPFPALKTIQYITSQARWRAAVAVPSRRESKGHPASLQDRDWARAPHGTAPRRGGTSRSRRESHELYQPICSHLNPS